ncbi:isochorismate synthase [Brevibacterium gallinarum]|uniref:isochorismate synthase n=1 Tax=Brevibacterium gallinarum TaxID=2762220 RepID=A0ABR8WS51_9MICO|nr:isochorismate synthase [Brevibacterium gallinarum]MBD8019906.1 isochorismate synthase [Brevibacterium gallinarum]
MTTTTITPASAAGGTLPIRADNQASDTSIPDFSFAAQGWTLRAHGGQLLTPVFADGDTQVADAVTEMLTAATKRSGRAHIVCGLIPFDTSEPACLRLTDDVTLTPRRIPLPAQTRRPADSAGTPHDQAAVPDSPHYRTAVSQALEHIAAGRVEKVVLARRMRLPLAEQLTPVQALTALLHRLNAANPTADVFHARLPHEQYWIGASPEVVADVHNGTLMTHPLAGSRPRLAGQRAPGPEFCTAGKDLREHAYVVDHIRAALADLTEHLSSPAAPELFATDCMWHLGTRITGRLTPGVSALAAALALHPTPAVCGSPAAAAADLITELEQHRRGFYSGLVGWTDAHGNGRWSLVLRSAQLSPTRLTLHAGAGIVAGSDPAAEHAETAAKFGTMLAAAEGLR